MKPVRSLPAKQCVSTVRPSASKRHDAVQCLLRSVVRGKPAVLVDHVAGGRDADRFVVGLVFQQPPERVLVRGFAVRVVLVGFEVRDGQQVDVDAVGYQTRAVALHFAARSQVGDIGDAQSA